MPAPNSRGMVLLLALTMTAMLAALGTAAVVRSSYNLRDGGAQRIQRAAYRMSEAGAMGVITLATQTQGGFVDVVRNSGLGDTTKGIAGAFDNTLLGAGLIAMPPDPAKVNAATIAKTDTSFGKELASTGGSFQTVVYEPDLTSAVPGFEAGQYCFHNFRMVTTATIGAAKPMTLQQILAGGEAAVATQVLVGPVTCGAP
jgi:hypothetical protein